MGRAAERQDGPMREVIILHIGENRGETSSSRLQINASWNLALKVCLKACKEREEYHGRATQNKR